MIPIDPKFTTGAQTNPPAYAVSLSLLQQTMQKEAFIPMQFDFVSQSTWKVDLRTGSPNPPLEKITNVYIDALNSTHDVFVYFPDTGYQVRVGAGTCFMCPSLIATNSYVFYVSLAGQITNATDLINIFVMNITIPYFDTLWQYPNGLNGNNSNWFYVGKEMGYNGNYIYNEDLYSGNNIYYFVYLNSFQLGFSLYNSNQFLPATVTYGLWYDDANDLQYRNPIYTNTVTIEADTTININDSISNINWYANPPIDGYGIWFTNTNPNGAIFSGPTLPRLLCLSRP